jgi:hypothetical protein
MGLTGRGSYIIGVLGIGLMLAVSGAASIDFADGFEDASLDTFWQTREQAGTISLSNVNVYSGNQSLQFNSEYDVGQKEIWLYHDFDEEMYGQATVWFYDTGADVWSSNYLAFQLLNLTSNTGCYVGTYDYDQGSPSWGSNYRYSYPGLVGGAISDVDRTQEWHKIEFTMTADTASVTLDGNVLYAGVSGTPFDAVRLRMYGPDWRPAFVSYWDEFSITAYPASVVPVLVDIKPGSYPNYINLGSNGVIPVAILSDVDFDATTVNPETVCLSGAGIAVRGKDSKYLAHEEDVNGDDLIDLVVQVETENLDTEQLQDGHAVISGSTYDGVAFEGQDEIIIVPPEN